MSSTFFGLTIAGSGLSAYQTATNTTANNISNVKTKGYSRQEATLNATDALRVNAKYGSTGTGVEVTQIRLQRNEYYDMKYWSNAAKLGEQETRASYLAQMETYMKDEETTVNGNKTTVGFTSIFGDMFNALDTLKTDAASATSRNAFIGKAKSLAEYFNNVSTQLTDLQSEINALMESKVADINSIGQKLASLTKQINVIEQQGGYANELRDERNVLIDKLSVMVPVDVEEIPVVNSNYPDMYTGATNYVVKINGQKLVDTYDYNKLICVPRENGNQVNMSDEDGLYDVFWAVNASSDEPSSMKLEFNSPTMNGSLKALYDLRDGNNANSFNGTIGDFDGDSKLTINAPSMDDPKEFTMPQSGTITLANIDYTYDGYKFIETTDVSGNVSYSFEFNLTGEADRGPVVAADIYRLVNKEASIGESVDFMGIPYYQKQLNEFVRSFSKAYNDISTQGVDIYGNASSAFFVANDTENGGEYNYSYSAYEEGTDSNGYATKTYSSDYYYSYLTAANFSISEAAMKDPNTIATCTEEAWTNGIDSYDLVEKLLNLKDGVTLFQGGVAGDFLQSLLSDISVDTQKAEIFTKNYQNLQDAIINQRMSVSSVDSDEEALNLVKFQNAYNLSSKLVQTLQQMYDRLILETGV
ncbi:MAG: flagellar hook-associated protein FlgK [Lachnospiraceae bacterium]|nr:flagellar hook-associated protein FlgK [Lachnospiraceae bacterium]